MASYWNSPIGITIGRLQHERATVRTTKACKDGEAYIVHVSNSFLVENGAVDDASGVVSSRCCRYHDFVCLT